MPFYALEANSLQLYTYRTVYQRRSSHCNAHMTHVMPKSAKHFLVFLFVCFLNIGGSGPHLVSDNTSCLNGTSKLKKPYQNIDTGICSVADPDNFLPDQDTTFEDVRIRIQVQIRILTFLNF
jgi:hypothetical protein